MYGEDKYAILKEKRRWILSGFLICGLLFFLLCEDEAEPSAGEIMMPNEMSEMSQQEMHEKAPMQRILGAEKAAKGEKLADPFSIAHLTREEMEQAKLAAEARQEESKTASQPAEPLPMLTETPMAAETREIPDNRKISLQGIVMGEHGRMAILQQADKSVSVAPGEKVGERIVAEIGEREVVFADGERIVMQIP